MLIFLYLLINLLKILYFVLIIFKYYNLDYNFKDKLNFQNF